MQHGNDEAQAALYGPQAKYSEYCKGDAITFCSRDTGGQTLTGTILFVRSAAPAIQGGRVLPACYIVFVPGESFIRVVFFGDVQEKREC